MRLPLRITVRNMEPSPALEELIREQAAKLDHVFDRISGCHVVVEAPRRHHHQGKLFSVRIDLTTDSGEFVANRHRPADRTHEDAYVAVRDAFDALRRELDDHTRREREKARIPTDQTPGAVA